MFSKITFLKSGDQAEKNEVCLSFLEEIFTKSVHRGGVELKDFTVLFWNINALKVFRIVLTF